MNKILEQLKSAAATGAKAGWSGLLATALKSGKLSKTAWSLGLGLACKTLYKTLAPVWKQIEARAK